LEIIKNRRQYLHPAGYGKINSGKYLTLDDLDLSPFADLSSSHQRSESEKESWQEDTPLQQRLEFLKSLTISQIESRRGCVHRCGFCNQSCLPIKGIRKSSQRRLVSEMEHMFNEYGITFFSLTDNVAFDSQTWWMEFAELMQSSPITPYVCRKLLFLLPSAILSGQNVLPAQFSV
jgi:hypothetical protein